MKLLLSILFLLSNVAHAGYTVECASNDDAYMLKPTGEVTAVPALVKLDLLFDDQGKLSYFSSDSFGCNENANLVRDEPDILLTCEMKMPGFHSKIKYTIDRLVGKFTVTETYDNGTVFVVNGRCQKSKYGGF